MAEIKGKKYKLAGFDILQRNSLVEVFAKFCRHEDDSRNLPRTAAAQPMFKNSPLAETPRLYPTITAQQIVDILVGPDDISAKAADQFRLPGGPEDLLEDLGAEKLALVLAAIGEAKKNYLGRDIVVRTFIPAEDNPPQP